MPPEPISLPTGLVLNGRTLRAPQSGVQRYAYELMHRFGEGVEMVAPRGRTQGKRGHFWEQVVLPARLHGRLLFSPGNTGPLACRQQVVTIHDASTFDRPEAFVGMFGSWYRWLLPRLARRVARIVTVSAFSRDRLVRHLGIAPGRISVIHNGVGQVSGHSDPEHDRWELGALRLPQRFLLFVGNRDPRKNLAGLLEAFEQVQAQLGDLQLVLAGGDNSRLFRDHGHERVMSDRVHVLGRVTESQLNALYGAAEGFVFPSLYEGFGLPPLEAMARGCPVLCADSSCLPEVCGPDFAQGGAPVYFEAGSVVALMQALVDFAASPPAKRDAMRAAGRQRAARFTWDRCARETANLLHEVARTRALAVRRHQSTPTSAAAPQP